MAFPFTMALGCAPKTTGHSCRRQARAATGGATPSSWSYYYSRGALPRTSGGVLHPPLSHVSVSQYDTISPNPFSFRAIPSGPVPVAGPLEAMSINLLQLPLPNIPERGWVTVWKRWLVPKVAVTELRRALDQVERWRPARRHDVSYFTLKPIYI